MAGHISAAVMPRGALTNATGYFMCLCRRRCAVAKWSLNVENANKFLRVFGCVSNESNSFVERSPSPAETTR